MTTVLVLYPFGNLETVPSLLAALDEMSGRGWRVRVLAPPATHTPEFKPQSQRVVLRHPPSGFFRWGGWTRPRHVASVVPSRVVRVLWRSLVLPVFWFVLAVWCAVVAAAPGRSLVVIGIDPAGLVEARWLAGVARAPLVYWSLEVLAVTSDPARRKLADLERKAARMAGIVVIQDPWRGELLSSVSGVHAHRLVYVPNARGGRAQSTSTRYLRELLCIKDDQTVVLCAGTIRSWAMTKEIVESARDWPENTTLVVHSRQRAYDAGAEYVREVQQIADGNRVILSFDSLPDARYGELVASADIGIACYNAVLPGCSGSDPNLQVIGYSSGKLSAYLQQGLPVIVNEATGPADLVREWHCGVVVREAAEIGAAIAEIMENSDVYSRNAIRCFNEVLSATDPSKRLCDRIQVAVVRREAGCGR